jgi:protocatechuate 3,4-dioxygenase, alpha subunit
MPCSRGTRLEPTPSQTVGPYLALGLSWTGGDDAWPLATGPDDACPRQSVAGLQVRLGGRLLDGNGDPIPDGMVETWQAGPDGRFDHPDDPRAGAGAHGGLRGFARSLTDPQGRWSVRTVLPGPVPGPDGSTQAPHLDVSVFARGLLHRVVTRIYFPQDADRPGPGGHAEDPVLQRVPAARRHTLVARAAGSGYQHDLRLQGKDETVFFDV